ncbi:MAG TPA: hypothetical protein VEQ58_00915 [Polyangiaceae bacterium]|nr:hypothetical protein [Polyangiaceae bacterium]
MRFASITPFTLMIVAALGCAAACGGDDDDDTNGTAGKGGSGGSSGSSSNNNGGGGEGGTPEPSDSQLCTDLGGPANINQVVRGDGKTSSSDAFNGFKFEKDGRQASVVLNAATDPCIGQQFARLLEADNADDLEHFAQCLSLFLQNAAGCNVAYDKDTSGKACKSMTAAHEGLGITEEDYTALLTDAAKSLNAAGVASSSSQFKAVAGALTSKTLMAEIITNDANEYSQPGAACEAPVGGGGGTGGEGGGPGGAGGTGGTPDETLGGGGAGQ